MYRFLKYHLSFVSTKERSIYQFPALKNTSIYSQKSIISPLWRRENPDSSEFTRCDRSSDTVYRIDRDFTDLKIPRNTKIKNIMT